MAYTKTSWLARQGTNLNKFAKSAETSNSVILVNAPDAVTQAGTPFSAENMNKIEQGIFEAHEDIAALIAGQPFGYIIPFQFVPCMQIPPGSFQAGVSQHITDIPEGNPLGFQG
jgi:aryl-phospho-beta-D-glucosidase BglC (GH1 family)